MKSKSISLLLVIMSLLVSNSCKKYLDIAPNYGIPEEEVFTKLANFKAYFGLIYTNSIYLGYTYTPGGGDMMDFISTTDAVDQCRIIYPTAVKLGLMTTKVNRWINGSTPILNNCFKDIRICNRTLMNIDMLTDATETEKNDLIAQAYFWRACCHFELFRLWGPMPYITKVIGPEDQWDIPRLTKHETCMKIALDLDTAYTYFEKAGKIRRDPGPGNPGHLADAEQNKPSGVTAKALKSRVLLYAASPLNTDGSTTDWTNAAAAAWDALKIALQKEYALLPVNSRSSNYYGAVYTNEQLWAYYLGVQNYNVQNYTAQLFNGIFMNNKSFYSGQCPTQNFVDKYETRWGEPLETQADRDAAAAAGHYKEQDMYSNRDPRLALDVIYNQSPAQGWSNGKAQIWVQVTGTTTTFSELLDQSYQGFTKTGYYLRKTWPNNSVKNPTPTSLQEPFIRLAELYLNYAEASNEAYGPTKIGVPGATLSALDAINIIRARVGQVNVLPQYTTTKEIFRNRVKNERNIELSFEGAHYFFDIRRWKDAPRTMTQTMMAVYIEKVPVSAEYPTGFKYTRTPQTPDRQAVWKDAMYYFPMLAADSYKTKNFVANEYW
jgi:hypothetical protein